MPSKPSKWWSVGLFLSYLLMSMISVLISYIYSTTRLYDPSLSYSTPVSTFPKGVPIVAVMGSTGSGKSFFIRAATGDESIKVGHSLEPETREINSYRLLIDEKPVVLLDTPGLDSTYQSGTEILQQLGKWFSSSCPEDHWLYGVLLMIPVDVVRFSDATIQSHLLLRNFGADSTLLNVAFVTTRWDRAREGKGERIEEELRRDHGSIGRLFQLGSLILRFDGTQESAKMILSVLLANQRPGHLQIQEETVEDQFALADIAAGKQALAEVMEHNQRDTVSKPEVPILANDDAWLKRVELLKIESLQTLEDAKVHLQPFFDHMEALESRAAEHSRLHENPDPDLETSLLAFIHRFPWVAVSINLFSLLLALSYILFVVYSSVEVAFPISIRPRVPDGYKRLKWTCSCGEALYGDYKDDPPHSLDELARKLAEQSKLSSRGSVSQPQGSASPVPATPGKTSSRHSSRPVGWSFSGRGGDNASDNHDTGNRNSQIPLSDSLNVTRSGPPSPIGPSRSLELCVYTGKYTQMLTEVRLESPPSDGAFFQAVKENYEGVQYSMLPFWMRLKRPSKAIFVKFRLSTRPLVSIMAGSVDVPSIPPKPEVDAKRYKYIPCPMDEPPMDSNTFMHHFYAPAWKHPDLLWAPRLPMKLGDSLVHLGRPLDQGWGVQLEEAPHWALFSTLMLFFLLVSGAVAGVYSWKTKDNPTGIAIGAWLTAVQTLAVAVAFFWWS